MVVFSPSLVLVWSGTGARWVTTKRGFGRRAPLHRHGAVDTFRDNGARDNLLRRNRRAFWLDTQIHHVYISYMSTAKSKPVVRKAAKAAPASDKVTFRASPPKAIGHFAVKQRRVSVLRDKSLSERLRHALGDLVMVNIADARTQIPKMIRSSAMGHTFLISNARAADAPAAVLIGLEELDRVVAEPVAARTLGDVLATLPFSGMDLSPPQAGALPGAGLPRALIPT